MCPILTTSKKAKIITLSWPSLTDSTFLLLKPTWNRLTVEQIPFKHLTICKLFCTSQTHHFSSRLFSYTCHQFFSLSLFLIRGAYTLHQSIAKIYIIDQTRAIALCRITGRNVCIYTSEKDFKWMGICERLESNKSIEMFLYRFLSSSAFRLSFHDWNSKENSVFGRKHLAFCRHIKCFITSQTLNERSMAGKRIQIHREEDCKKTGKFTECSTPSLSVESPVGLQANR